MFSKLADFLRHGWSVVFDKSHIIILSVLLFIFEVLLSVFVVHKVKYTEIDWVAYMQEVEGFLNGTLDYEKLEGQTGPLVYPAGFVYIYSLLYHMTSKGINIRLGQYIFLGIYLINLILVFNIYRLSRKIPPYALIFMCCTSYRIHSIYMLRLFNDPVAMLFLYASINALLYNRVSLGCILYSLGVSVKMNVLLFAPGLLVVLLRKRGVWATVGHLAECAIVQVLLGMPFLIHSTSAYMHRAFEFKRQFLFKWTVNWRFLPETLFANPWFHTALLFCQLLFLAVFLYQYIKKHGGVSLFTRLGVSEEPLTFSFCADDVIYPLFISNFLGVAFSRSLHYQFYVWYFHTLPYLLWSTRFRRTLNLLLLGLVEMCWNTYPSTVFSSAVLHVCHGGILTGLLYTAYRDRDNGSAKPKDI